MNVYAAVVLLALVGRFALELAAGLLERRSLGRGLPAEFEGAIDPATYARSQEYARARTRLTLVREGVDLACLLAFWAAGGFGWLDAWARGLGWGPVGTGLVFLGALLLLQALLHLPFELASTFGVEERFGFNRTDARTFWTDRAKGLLLGVVLGAPLLALVLLFFERAGELAWLWCWLTVAAFTLAVQYVAPAWLLPLFHRFEPLADEDLESRLRDYARSVGFPVAGIWVVDGSRRSTKANAFFTGFGATKRIALFDTLVEGHTQDEVLAVVAHEVGHQRRGHVVQNTVLGVLQAGLALWVLSLFLDSRPLFEAFGVSEPSVYAGLAFFLLLWAPIDLALSVAGLALSRRHEFEADAFAARTTGAAGALASALRKLAVQSLSNLTPHPLHVALHASHPPVTRRIQRLTAAEATPADG